MICIALLASVLVAGLWPFHAPKNQITWDSEGLRFGRHGSAVSQSSVSEGVQYESSSDASSAGAGSQNGSTVELWLRPDLHRRSGVILSFDSPHIPAIPLVLRQIKDALVVQLANRDRDGDYKMAWLPVPGAMREQNAVFVTVIVAAHHADVYLDGGLARSFPVEGTSSALAGRLLLSGLPNSADSWTGTIRGLAIYKKALSAEQVAADYRSWTLNGHVLSSDLSAAALYDFSEPSGNLVHDHSGSRNDFVIPAKYFVLHPVFLRSPWRAYRNNWPYWQDMLVNVVGFVPLGLFLAAYFSQRNASNAFLIAALFGIATSFTIEGLQYFLPTRDSGATDLITNEFGTVIGAALYRWGIAGRFAVEIATREHLVTMNERRRAVPDLV